MINLVVAIPCEARPLIRHLRLQKQAYGSYTLYTGEDLRLVVCGVGKLAAASACAWLQGRHETPDSAAGDAWLNIGIAGHGYQPLGSGLLAHRISDRHSGRHWYPAFTFKRPCPSATLITVEQPENRYDDNTLYDMEAAGFVAGCQRFSSAELIHSFKVVSDNHFSGIDNIDEGYVTELIAAQLTMIERILDCLQQNQRQLADCTAAPSLYDTCLQHWHFSHYQRKQLLQLLRRHRALSATDDDWPAGLEHLRSATEVLAFLQREVERRPVLLSR
jgi:hypothetical protein